MSGGPAVRVALPAGARIGLPVFSHDGRRFAFARDLADGVELWAGETTTGAARPVPGVRLNDVLGPAFAWTGRRHAPRADGAGGPRARHRAAPTVPVGPDRRGDGGQGLADGHLPGPAPHAARRRRSSSTSRGRSSSSWTPRPGRPSPLGEPGLFTDAEPSPDGRYLLVERVKAPFSTRVPYFYFARATEVWDAAGRPVATVADLPVSDEIPRQGVPTGPRASPGSRWRRRRSSGSRPSTAATRRRRCRTASAS